GTPTFLFGHERFEPIWYYFPLALLFKWPLGFLGALAHRGLRLGLGRDPPRRHQDWVLLPGLMFLLASMFLVQLNAGVRYVFPLLPLGCVWVGGLLRRAPRAPASAAHVRVALAWLVLAGIEAGACAPWYLTFFNWPSGGPGGGYRLVNDSNVDWGQGLIALRDEMRRRGIERIHLAYHGTTDPAIYGIDYVPYFGGTPGPESDWIAISSYYFVGQRTDRIAQVLAGDLDRTVAAHQDQVAELVGRLGDREHDQVRELGAERGANRMDQRRVPADRLDVEHQRPSGPEARAGERH